MLVPFADTDCDVTPEIAAEYGYRLISMPYSIDGKTIYPYEDFDVFESRKYYDMLRSGVIPTTSAVSEEKYREYFEPVFAAGDDILYVHFSAAMSATFGIMDGVVKELLEKYPGRKFYSVDTMGITIVSLLVVKEVGDMLKAGKSPEEIVAWADREVPCFSQYFFADDLKFFRRSGRVSGLAAAMGGLIGIRPIIYMNAEGKMVSIGKETGRAKAINRLISEVREKGDDVVSHRVIIGHTDSPDIAEEIKNRLIAEYGENLRVEICVTNPTAGAHCGPNGVGVAFHSVHR